MYKIWRSFYYELTIFVAVKLIILAIGKPNEPYIKEGVEMFTSRLQHYFPTEWKIIPPLKNSAVLDTKNLMMEEGKKLLKEILPGDYVVLLDERGKQFSSVDLSAFILKISNESFKRIVFIIGGAFGVDQTVRGKADLTWSLSKLVFPHMLVRLILAEQLYRACTILKNEKYHHV
ncbi:MAG: 23S rRNA (pseudouridine(1915)-N(3))-methyltransferase RlmH [Bacteroidota bacterium]